MGRERQETQHRSALHQLMKILKICRDKKLQTEHCTTPAIIASHPQRYLLSQAGSWINSLWGNRDQKYGFLMSVEVTAPQGLSMMPIISATMENEVLFGVRRGILCANGNTMHQRGRLAGNAQRWAWGTGAGGR